MQMQSSLPSTLQASSLSCNTYSTEQCKPYFNCSDRAQLNVGLRCPTCHAWPCWHATAPHVMPGRRQRGIAPEYLPACLPANQPNSPVRAVPERASGFTASRHRGQLLSGCPAAARSPAHARLCSVSAGGHRLGCLLGGGAGIRGRAGSRACVVKCGEKEAGVRELPPGSTLQLCTL